MNESVITQLLMLNNFAREVIGLYSIKSERSSRPTRDSDRPTIKYQAINELSHYLNRDIAKLFANFCVMFD